MYSKIIIFIVFYTVYKVHISMSNDTGSVSFDKLELQIEKISKYI